eukprot:TRINITY_DN4552_c0_g1_i1.p2 TRINITY_DN4552_c0_g1~~TRINITY_DN4552_c0_g1_i1.p2  ORF type:complete len:154 (-),score=62.24 TRINITY_DN4552_c0_g1_i1:53-514(-)
MKARKGLLKVDEDKDDMQATLPSAAAAAPKRKSFLQGLGKKDHTLSSPNPPAGQVKRKSMFGKLASLVSPSSSTSSAVGTGPTAVAATTTTAPVPSSDAADPEIEKRLRQFSSVNSEANLFKETTVESPGKTLDFKRIESIDESGRDRGLSDF